MVKSDDTSATEKLLEMIREEQKGEGNTPAADGVEPPAAHATTPLTMEKEPPPPPEQPTSSKKPKKQSVQSKAPQNKLPSTFSFSPVGKTDGIGIDIRTDGIGLVRVAANDAQLSAQDSLFLSFDLETPLKETGLLSALLESDWFASFLRKGLNKFCGNAKKVNLWCSMPREAVDTHNVTVPKVPDKELANTVFWSTQKDFPFDRNAIILDFEPVKELTSDKGTKILCLIFLAPRREVDGLKKLFSTIGYSLEGISAPASALANEIRCGNLQVREESFSHLSLGEEKSFIELYYQNRLIFSRDIKTGVGSIVDSLLELAQSQNISIEENTCRDLLLGTPQTQLPQPVAELIGDGEDIFTLELPAAVRLVRQMERTFDYCKKHFNVPRSSLVYLSGLSRAGIGLTNYVNRETGVDCDIHQPSSVGITSGSTSTIPDSRLVTAFGMALADKNASQNFLNPYEKKELAKQIGKVNRYIVVAGVVLFILCTGFYFLQNHQLEAKKKILAELTREIQNSSLAASQDKTALLFQEKIQLLKKTSAGNIKLAERYYPMALVQELTKILPTQAKLLHLSLSPPVEKEDGDSEINTIIMEGIITGRKKQREFVLAKYLKKISASPFVYSATVTNKEKFRYQKNKVLGFTIDIVVNSLPTQNAGGAS